MGKGIFGGLFDFNHDGKMSAFERAAEIGFLHHMIESEKKENHSGSNIYGYHPSTSTAFCDDDDQEDKALDLIIAGLDETELSLMDEDDRRVALEDAGLDPEDFAYLADF